MFGATSSPGVANFGLKRAADDSEEFGIDAQEYIKNDFYVDDGPASKATVEEAIRLVDSTVKLCNKAGLVLHKWVSNSREVLAAIPNELRANAVQQMKPGDKLPIERVLGLLWCTETDSFCFKSDFEEHPITRRGIMATVCSVYDPLGFLAPVMLSGKAILQNVCREGTSWDDPLPEDLKITWNRWKEDIIKLETVRINRCMKPNRAKVKSIELHHFSDASEDGYGQCSYLRVLYQDSSINVAFVTGKARVTPLNRKITIPRFELTAAVVSARMSSYLRKELKLESVKEYYWTDSRVVLGYLRNKTKHFKVYVANRVQIIRDLTEVDEWKYVRSEDNPSDEASRGLSAAQFIDNPRWLNGPKHLWDKAFDPKYEETFNYEDVEEIDCEIKHNSMATDAAEEFDLLRKFDRYSTWYKACRVAAQLLRVKGKLLEKSKIGTSGGLSPQMDVQEVKNGEISLLRLVQKGHFNKEFQVLGAMEGQQSLRERKVMLQKSSNLSKLDPFLDNDELLKVGGRLRNSCLLFDVKHPVILPKSSHITTLIIRMCHEEVNHMGRNSTLNDIRQRGYWIVNGSSATSQYVHQFVTCRRRRGALETQKMADLPIDRTVDCPPYTYVAFNIFGPFEIKERRLMLKRYGAIFVCMVTKAIHLETTNSLETDAFINAMRRFLCIRGPVRQIRADCGTNFRGARNELKQALQEMNHQSVAEYLLKQKCDYVEFKFNVPRTSHMEGIWERQIRTVRSVLEPLIYQAGKQLNDESLRTLMAEAQYIVNSRPIAVNHLSEVGAPIPLTPNQIITMKPKVLMPPPGVFQREDVYCLRWWRRVQHFANKFWSQIFGEYLAQLQQRQKWQTTKRNMRIRDIVILKESDGKRSEWELARVTDLYPGEDGLVHKVSVYCGRRRIKLDRPIHKLVLLLPN